MSFALDISKFVAKAKGGAHGATRRIVYNMLKRVVLRSPVGDPDLWESSPPPGYAGGRFRGNWQVGVNTVPAGELDIFDENGAGTIVAGLNKIPHQAGGKVYYIVNNLPYAEALENGHSSQAPNGMVGLTVLEFEQAVREALNK